MSVVNAQVAPVTPAEPITPVAKDTNIIVMEDVDRVLPQTSNIKVVNNEIYDVLIESNKSDEDLLAFKNQKINKVMYVMDVILSDDTKIFKVFVTDPPKPKKKGEKEKTEIIHFDMSAFKYSPENPIKNQDFITMDTPFDLGITTDQSKKILFSLLAVMFILPLLYLGRKLILKYKITSRRRRILRDKTDGLIEVIKTAKTRSDFETIYAVRKDIDEYIELNNIEFKKFLEELNKIQFMKDWNEDQLAKITQQYKKIGEPEVIDGV